MRLKSVNVERPNWRDFVVKQRIPQKLAKLDTLARNIWWSWDYPTRNLFRDIDSTLWRETEHNPVALLERVQLKRLEELTKDKKFMANLDAQYERFSAYMSQKPDKSRPSIAYFSMEYGLSNVLKIYSGGLGILAGDYLKEASDINLDMVAVGFFYRYGYFRQTLSMDGQQVNNYDRAAYSDLPMEQVTTEEGAPFILEVPYKDHTVYAQVWKVSVGRISLYLMDTDIEQNSEWDRSITHTLYGGDWENRLKQEYLLGIGGILLLRKLGIKKDIYHCNEGHAALLNMQRLAEYVELHGLSFAEAMEVVRSSSLYTVHTPVPAGHDAFEEGLFEKYMGHFANKLGISWDELMDLGRENPGQKEEKFSMSVFACNMSQEVNGVSKLHGWVSQKMFSSIWKGYFPEELHVGYVTNGVHMPTWASSQWQEFYKQHFDKEFYSDQSNTKHWEAVQDINDSEIWNLRTQMKTLLVDYIKDEFAAQWLKNQGDPTRVMSVVEKINPNALIIGFARRFATYKRAHLLFSDLDRLAKILNNPDRPVQFIFAGKAHPHDGAGQGLIKLIVEISRRPEFLGKIIFLENYDMRLAKRLVSGVDIWMNTPTRPLEASGTSGEKAEMNGVLNLSVLDGWWYEGYREKAGWALTEKRTYKNQEHQDRLDASTIYSMLENEIIPLYYAKNSKGYSPEWIQYIKNSLSQIAPIYTTKRMIEDYLDKFYTKEANRKKKLIANDYAKAKELAQWKSKVEANWDKIEIISCTMPSEGVGTSFAGDTYTATAILDLKDLVGSVGVDFVVMRNVDGESKLDRVLPMKVVKTEGTRVYFELENSIQKSGQCELAFRMYPIHPDMPHRMDFCYVRWF